MGCRITNPFQILCKLPSRDLSLFTKMCTSSVLHGKAFYARFARPAIIRSEASGNGVASPGKVSKHSKEELIVFFRDIQTSIAESSPKASKRARKQPADPLKEVDRREQSHGISGGDGGAGNVSEEQWKVMNLEDMNVADLRDLARARRMRGYSKLKKGELIDRLKGVMQ